MRIGLAVVASVAMVAAASPAVGAASPAVAARARPAAPPDVIRTGGPSKPADAKIAIVATSKPTNGKRFQVLDALGRVVFRSTLTRAPGTTAPWKHATQADLSTVTEPGGYRIRTGRLTSRPWVIADNATQSAIATMLQFFAANSDGNEPSPVHTPSHLNDATIASGPYAGQHIDLTGGWMDAGDMIKFTQTTGHAAAMLQAAARLDPAQADTLNAAADVGIRWLVKAHPQADVFIGQVGDERDHDLGFRNPARDDANALAGIGTRMAYPAVGGDLAGKAAAALAMAAQRATGPEHDALLQQAREWYDAGSGAGAVAKLPGAFYDSSTFADDLAAGAAELFRATGEQQYLSDAVGDLSGEELDAAFGWDSFGGFAAADICGLFAAPQLSDQPCPGLTAAGSSGATRARHDAFGMAADFGWGSTAELASSGLSAFVADNPRVAAGARDYLLGRNPWGASFVVGFGPRSPRHPHHWATVFGPGKPIGAVVGGPVAESTLLQQKLKLRHNVFSTARAYYSDDRSNYVTSEPALDYTADSVLLLAALSR